MKKYALLSFLILFPILTFSQAQIKFEPFYGETPVQPKIMDDALCSQSNVDPQFYWFPSIARSSQLIANDLFVEPNEIFTFEQITVDLVSTFNPGIDNIDVIIWSDDGGLPDTVLHSELALVPTTQTLVGDDPFGNEVYEVIIDLLAPPELEGGTSGAIYWVQLFAHQTVGGAGWHASEDNIVRYNFAIDQGGGWFLETIPFDCLYVFSGDCTPVLDVADNASERISIYPIPTNAVINIKIPKEFEEIETTLYTLSGQKIDIPLINEKLDISHVSEGVYMLHLTTPHGTMVKKIIKQ